MSNELPEFSSRAFKNLSRPLPEKRQLLTANLSAMWRGVIAVFLQSKETFIENVILLKTWASFKLNWCQCKELLLQYTVLLHCTQYKKLCFTT